MIDLIEHNREQIIALCKKHGVKHLELFGSAARGDDFDPETSDVDFLYAMDRENNADLADRYFTFIEDLEIILEREVDLVPLNGTSNPYFWAVVNRCRIPLHAA